MTDAEIRATGFYLGRYELNSCVEDCEVQAMDKWGLEWERHPLCGGLYGAATDLARGLRCEAIVEVEGDRRFAHIYLV